MKGPELLYLTQEDLIKTGLLNFKEALINVEIGIGWHSSGESLSDKIALDLDPRLEWKVNSLVAVNGKYSANKWLGSSLLNKEQGLPRTTALITLNDKKSGIPLCVMDGTLLSAVRTGCYAALGIKYLGQKRNNLGIIGSGVMARTTLMAIYETFPERVCDVFVYSRNPEHSVRYKTMIEQNTGISVTTKNIGDLVRESDITISAITKDDEILVKKEDVKQGSTHIHIGGWDDEESYIVDCVRNGKVVCDDWELIKKRHAHPLPLLYNKGVIKDRDIYGNMGDIILGNLPGREGDENIYFDTVGLGEMDLVLAISMYESALRIGLGQKLKIWEEPHWILESYR